MAITKDELAQKNFGYLNGSDLMQFCPFEILSSQYNKFSELFQTGCNQAYAEITGELSTRYDVQRELSNANQTVLKQEGNKSITIAAGSYISNIELSSDLGATVQIGTTSTGSDIMVSDEVFSKVLWVNKNFAVATTLYFQITGIVSFTVVCNSGVKNPPITVKELLNQTGSFTFDIAANTYLYQIFASILLSTPSIKIGTTLGGEEVVELTVVDNDVLVIETGMNYFASATTLYFTVTVGSVDLRMDIGYNYIAPTPILNPLREPLFAQITSIVAIKNILGSMSGDNTLLKSHFAWAYDKIEKIKARQMNLRLNSPPASITSRAYMVGDSFKTLG